MKESMNIAMTLAYKLTPGDVTSITVLRYGIKLMEESGHGGAVVILSSVAGCSGRVFIETLFLTLLEVNHTPFIINSTSGDAIFQCFNGHPIFYRGQQQRME